MVVVVTMETEPLAEETTLEGVGVTCGEDERTKTAAAAVLLILLSWVVEGATCWVTMVGVTWAVGALVT